MFVDAAGRALLVEPTYKDHWEILGGVVEPGESPHGAAVRELKEELGLSLWPGRLLVVDWVWSHPHRTDGVMFVYDGGVLTPEQTAEIRLPADELRSWAWSTVDELHALTGEALARRIAAALQARADATTVYLEHGLPVIREEAAGTTHDR